MVLCFALFFLLATFQDVVGFRVTTETGTESEMRLASAMKLARSRRGNVVSAGDPPKFPFPEELKWRFGENPVHLGTGGFGEVWLVKDKKGVPGLVQPGSEVALKLLYKGNDFARWDVAKEKDAKLMEDLRTASSECDMSTDMISGGDQSHKGRSRIMACYEHNIPSSDSVSSSDPIYMVLENCGKDELGKFMERHAANGMWSAELVLRIYEQLLEALDYLSPKFVHHDLKPENVVIKVISTSTHDKAGKPLIASRDDVFELYLIDFGASITVSFDDGFANACDYTASTLGFAPSEWFKLGCGSRGDKMYNFDTNCEHCPLGFDMFASTSLLVQMLTGVYADLALPDKVQDDDEAFNWVELDKLVRAPEQFIRSLQGEPHYTNGDAFKVFTDPKSEYYALFKTTIECLSPRADARLDAFELHAVVQTVLAKQGKTFHVPVPIKAKITPQTKRPNRKLPPMPECFAVHCMGLKLAMGLKFLSSSSGVQTAIGGKPCVCK